MATNCYAEMFGCLHFYKIVFPNLERYVGLRLEKCWSGGQEFCGFQVGKKGKKVGGKKDPNLVLFVFYRFSRMTQSCFVIIELRS